MRNINHCFIILFSLLFAVSAKAQQLTVDSFFEAMGDITASAQSSLRLDNNGIPCALVKVYLPVEGAVFRGNTVGKPDFQVNQYWVYMTEHSKILSIDLPGYLPLEVHFSDYTVSSLQSKTTYILTVNTGGPVRIQQQYLQIQVSPKEALVELDGELVVVRDGVASKRVRLGNYRYRVSADGYHDAEGSVSVFDPNAPTLHSVTLKPAFGWLSLSDESSLAGARVYADNKMIGEGIISNCQLPSGQHSIRIIKDGYKPFSQSISIEDGQTTILAVSLNKDAAGVSFTVKDNAEIWINEEQVGTGSWIGELAAGEYIVETRLPGRQTRQRVVEVTPESNQTIELDVPGYYYGSLDMNSFPVGASLSIDGQYVGLTPLVKNDITVGNHQIYLTKSEYKGYSQIVNIEADKITELSVDLVRDDKAQPMASASQEDLVAPNPVAATDAASATASSQSGPMQSQPNKVKTTLNEPNIYFDAFYQLGSMSGIGAGIGAYFHRFNIEADFVSGLSESEPIYWDGNATSYVYTYKANILGAKLGYLIPVGTRMGLTPQLGVGIAFVKGSVKQKGTGVDPNMYKTYGVPMDIALRLNYSITRSFGLTVCPAYSFAINKGSIYTALSNIDSKVKGFSSGFNIRAGFTVCF